VSGDSGALEAALAQLAELRDQVTMLEATQAREAQRLDKLTAAITQHQQETYEPVPAPRWWEASRAQRAEAITRLRSWVATVYRPGYGHLAAKLRPCWERHDLCLYVLDWLSETWAVIYHPPGRDSGLLWTAADWHTRFLPAAAALLEAETASCDHLTAHEITGADPWAGTP